jgi:hypothetical protein
MAAEVRFADIIVIQQVLTSTLERDLDHFQYVTAVGN